MGEECVEAEQQDHWPHLLRPLRVGAGLLPSHQDDGGAPAVALKFIKEKGRKMRKGYI